MKKLKSSYFVIVSLIISYLSIAQPSGQYGNEWINYSQIYYKFPIYKKGIYKIDSITLANAGFPLQSIDPRNIQIFLYGQEQYIYIQGEDDGIFNSNDFIEFYGEIKPNLLDTHLYTNVIHIPNPYVGVTTKANPYADSDTVYAFITYNNSTNNKRVTLETDTTFSAHTPINNFYTEHTIYGKNSYNYIPQYAGGIFSDARYTNGEGYMVPLTTGGHVETGYLSIANIYTTQPLPVYLKFSVSGIYDDYTMYPDHHLRVKWWDGGTNTIAVWDTTFDGWQHFVRTYTANANIIIPGMKPYIELVSDANTSAQALLGVHYIYCKYPATPNWVGWNEGTIYLNDNTSQSKTFLYFNNITGGTNNAFVFYDLTNHKRIESVFNANTLKVLVPNGGNEKKCFFTATSNIINVNQLRKVNNNTGYFTNFSIPKDSAFIIISHTSLMSAANQYKTHRESVSGGNFNVILADVEELYEQFAYGTPKHPQSIRNFCKFLMDTMPSNPQYLLLIGKAYSIEYYDYSSNLVPTMGWPASDLLLTAKLHLNDNLTPEIPTGRLSATSTSEVINYLNKIQQFENPEFAEWKKQVLHFAGGTSYTEQTAFLGYVNQFKSIIEDTLFGGKVLATFKKTTSDPIQTTIPDSVKTLIDNGVGLITYFGHSSTNALEIAIDNVNDYNNSGKYPIMLINGCNVGNIYSNLPSVMSESWVLSNQKGAIAFLASASVGLANYLYMYSLNFYKNLSYNLYGKSIGKNIQSIAQSSSSLDIYSQLTVLDMNLHGDPSIKLWNGLLPDYQITNADVSFDTQSHPDSIGVIINVKNLGKAINDTFIVRITRTFPNNDTSIILKKWKVPYYQSTYKTFIYTDYSRAGGVNKFSVYIDFYYEIAESNESNNSTIGSLDLFINSEDILPVYPYKYAIVPKTSTIVLKASTIDPLTTNTAWRFQLDTTDKFINPIQQAVIYSPGGVVEWQVNLPFKDSTVYYWRVSKDSLSSTDKYNWHESSFQTIGNKRGWGQAHYFQFKNDAYQYVKYNLPQRNFIFSNSKIAIYCRTGIFGLSPLNFDQIITSLNGIVIRTWSCALFGWNIIVLDSISGQPWIDTINNVQIGPYGNCHCVPGERIGFDFGDGTYCSNPNWQQDLVNFINNVVPNDNYVLAYSPVGYTNNSYIPSFYTAMQSIGSANIINHTDTLPMIIFGKKGMLPGQAHEVRANSKYDVIELKDTITTKWDQGYILSEIIGPAFKWNSFHWRVTSLDNPKTDTTIVKIIGIKADGQKDTLATFTEDSLDVMDLYNYVDASIYPQIQLIAFMKDNVNFTAPQLKRWQVLYDDVPECAINPKKTFYFKNDTIQQGDNFIIAYAIENISHATFQDSLLITYRTEKNNISTSLPDKLKIKPFHPSAIIVDTLSINTLTLSGNHNVWIDVNPPGHPKYQLEQYHFNNLVKLSFNTSKDVINPLLDVTFDGIRILNGDIVSAKPHILISLSDENKYLLLNDTSDIQVYLQKQGESEKQLFLNAK